MNILVKRNKRTADGIFGELSLDWNPFTCFTVENLIKEIPIGDYDVVQQYSPHFNRLMPHIIVPDRTFIMIHWANYPSQLEGCIAVGDKEEPDAVDDSIVTFNRLDSLTKTILAGLKIRITEAL